MRKGKYTMLISVAVLTALIVTSGCYKKTPEQRAEDMVQHIAATLELNAAQTAKLEKIKDEFLARQPEMLKMREETVKEANALMRSTQIDQARLNALLDKDQKTVDDYVRFVAAKFTEIHDMLTPDQRDKLVTTIEKHMRNRSPS
jgi:Spy/CpxP family protein refolding chaperone